MHFQTNTKLRSTDRFALYRGRDGKIYCVDVLCKDVNKSIDRILEPDELEEAT